MLLKVLFEFIFVFFIYMLRHDKKKTFEIAKELIPKHSLLFVEDIIALLPCCKPKFYEMFPVGSDELNALKDLLETNRVSMKVNMRKKWYKSDNATLQMALMKLIANKEELMRLAVSYNANEDVEMPLFNLTDGDSTVQGDNDNKEDI